jgi:hypothetical protein
MLVVARFAQRSAPPGSVYWWCNHAAIHLFRQLPLHWNAYACSWKIAFPPALRAYAREDRAGALEGGDMGEALCMDTACLGVVLASRTQDVIGMWVVVNVDVNVDAPQGRA